MKRRIRWMGWLMVLFLITLPWGYVEANTDLEKRVNDLEKEQTLHESVSESIKNYNEFLQQETQRFRSDIQAERESLISSFNWFLGVLSVVLIALQVFLYIMIGNSKKEAKENIQQELQQLEKQLKTKVQTLKQEYEQQLNTVIKQMQEQLQEQLQANQQELEAVKQNIRNELTFVSSRIAVTSPSENELHRMKDEELQTMDRCGIKHVEPISWNLSRIKKAITQGDMDILIYSCQKLAEGEVDQSLFRLIDCLIELDAEVPLVIYTYQLGRYFNKAEMKEINKYPNAICVNLPPTLLGHLFTLSYAFNRQTQATHSDFKR